ncbi:HAD-like protein [Cystobasidium minutum MCA 4210]|uniref:HAD-like protein n=1 Tax=Cystobasidium minutum MCA 4210 TaxID=1397322 RepID=UPI0034CE2D55|eukprot:jgi/Rhomi1/45369/CE45368_179
MSTHSIEVEAILFDMDGTLIDSTAAVTKTYLDFCHAHGIEVTGHPHGIRTRDTMRKYFPDASEQDIEERTRKFESDIVETAKALEAEGKTGLVVLPNVRRILDTIRTHEDADSRYTICTSATSAFAAAALEASGIHPPKHLLTAEDCSKGKPHPEPYLKGAQSLSRDITKCLVVEDAPSGIKSGQAAGAKVLAVCTSHKRPDLEHLDADFIVDNLEQIEIEVMETGGFRVTIKS